MLTQSRHTHRQTPARNSGCVYLAAVAEPGAACPPALPGWLRAHRQAIVRSPRPARALAAPFSNNSKQSRCRGPRGCHAVPGASLGLVRAEREAQSVLVLRRASSLPGRSLCCRLPMLPSLAPARHSLDSWVAGKSRPVSVGAAASRGQAWGSTEAAEEAARARLSCWSLRKLCFRLPAAGLAAALRSLLGHTDSPRTLAAAHPVGPMGAGHPDGCFAGHWFFPFLQ